MKFIKKIQLYFIAKVLRKFAENAVLEIEIVEMQMESGRLDDNYFAYLDGRLSAFNTVLWWISEYSRGTWELFDD